MELKLEGETGKALKHITHKLSKYLYNVRLRLKQFVL